MGVVCMELRGGGGGDLCLLTNQSQGVLSSDSVLSAVPVAYVRESVSELNLYIIIITWNDEEISPLYSTDIVINKSLHTYIHTYIHTHLPAVFVNTEHSMATESKQLRPHLLPPNHRQYVSLSWHLYMYA